MKMVKKCYSNNNRVEKVYKINIGIQRRIHRTTDVMHWSRMNSQKHETIE